MFSEVNLQSDLKDSTPILYGSVLAKERGVSDRDSGKWPKVRLVEDIEGFHPQLKAQGLVDRGVLDQREIRVVNSEAAHHIVARISERRQGGLLECIDVEGTSRRFFKGILTGNQARARRPAALRI